MDDKKLFSIGDVARLFHLSVSSLRHYEKEGLLTPEYVSPESGYRYYSTRQFEVLNTIRYLRALDMPLYEISDFLKNREVGRIEEKLRQQKAAVEEKQRELKRIERKIDNRLKQLNEAQNARINCVEIVRAAACRMVWLDDSLNIGEFLDMEAPIRRLEKSDAEPVVFLGKVGVSISKDHLVLGEYAKYDSIFLILDEEDNYDGQMRTLGETQCMRVRFRGSRAEAPEQYSRLMDFAHENGLKICGPSREVTMIDYGITSDTEKFVTEILIPVDR